MKPQDHKLDWASGNKVVPIRCSQPDIDRLDSCVTTIQNEIGRMKFNRNSALLWAIDMFCECVEKGQLVMDLDFNIPSINLAYKLNKTKGRCKKNESKK